MCGIAGILSRNEPSVRHALSGMVRAQKHRGPDDSGEFVDSFGNVILGLGHRRLSILDLSPLGHQPMIHPQTGNVIVFNGEIYNFRALREELIRDGESFTSTGDTEVLLRGLTLHGESFLTRLQGMYAFAFLHKSERRLLLVRDPMGIKPLYYSQADGNFLFASEVRALIQTGLIRRDLDDAGVAGLLAFGAVQQPATIFRHIRMLMPGHMMSLSIDPIAAQSPRQYWHFPSLDQSLTAPDPAQLRSLLSESVRDHLESDVPVGVFLSSGIDSTIVAGLAREHTSHVKTFTVGFADHADLSESELARQTAELMQLDHTEITVNSDAAAAAASEWLATLDQPSVDGLNVFLIAKVVRAHGITVALSGQGGDELFGGYPSFVDVPFLRKTIRKISWLPRWVRGMMAKGLSAGRTLAYRQKLQNMLCSDGSVAALYLQRRRMMSDSQLTALNVNDDFASPEYLLGSPVSNVLQLVTDEIASISRLEAMLYQGNMLLRDGDTNGMAHGLEIRVPLLDQRVVNYVSRLPGALRLPPGSLPKHLLRTSCTDLLRPALVNQPKRGFSLPIRRWMVGPMREICEEAIDHLKQTDTLDRRGVHAVWTAFLREPESPIWSRAFVLVVLGNYLKRMTSVPAPG